MPAAERKARTRKVGSLATSSRNAIRRRSVAGSRASVNSAAYSMVRMRRGLSIVMSAISPSPTAAVRRLGRKCCCR